MIEISAMARGPPYFGGGGLSNSTYSRGRVH